MAEDEYDAALKELERIGWPCRLRELPGLYERVVKENEAHVELLKAMTRATGGQMEDLDGLRRFARQCGSPDLLTATLDRVFDYTKYQLEELTEELSKVTK